LVGLINLITEFEVKMINNKVPHNNIKN